jgi:hypothetical protein
MGFVRRRARRRTALLVGGAAYAAGKHRAHQQDYQDESYGEPQGGGYGAPQGGYDAPPPPPPPAPPPAAPSQAIDYDELKQLGELHANGTLTDEEFAAAKAKILGT